MLRILLLGALISLEGVRLSPGGVSETCCPPGEIQVDRTLRAACRDHFHKNLLSPFALRLKGGRGSTRIRRGSRPLTQGRGTRGRFRGRGFRGYTISEHPDLLNVEPAQDNHGSHDGRLDSAGVEAGKQELEVEGDLSSNEVTVDGLVTATEVSRMSRPTFSKHGYYQQVWMDKVDQTVLYEVLEKEFGLREFRPGQKEVIEKILTGNSALFISATGSGKSLTYQLPASLLPGVSVVVTPLLALIQDQMANLPSGLSAVTLNSQMTRVERQAVVEKLLQGSAKILFIAPEGLFSDSFQTLARRLTINFVAVDEAHCASEWAHNFRPSYMRMGKVLKERYGVKCILALTATATPAMEADLRRLLAIAEEGVIRTPLVRNNLVLTVRKGIRSHESLLQLIDEIQATMSDTSGIIVYCALQRTCDIVAKSLRAKGKAASRYHSGCSPGERKTTQEKFLNNELDIVVATIAFGMGVNKPDVRAVIHFNSPNSVEAYVQQVGRAGRDGKPALGFLFLENEDFIRQRSLAHSSRVEDRSIAGLIRAVLVGGGSRAFRQQKVKKGEIVDREERVTISEELCRRLDMYPETMETILSFMDLDGVLSLLSKGPTMAVIEVQESGRNIEQEHGQQGNHKDTAFPGLESDEIVFAVKAVGKRVKDRLSDISNVDEDTERRNDKLLPRYSVELPVLAKKLRTTVPHLQRMLVSLEGSTLKTEVRGSSWIAQIHELHPNITMMATSIVHRLRCLELNLVEHVDQLYHILSLHSTGNPSSHSASFRIADLMRSSLPAFPHSVRNDNLLLQDSIQLYFSGHESIRPPWMEQKAVNSPQPIKSEGEDAMNIAQQTLSSSSPAPSLPNITETVRALLGNPPPYLVTTAMQDLSFAAIRDDVISLLQAIWGITKKRLTEVSITRIMHGISSPAFPGLWCQENAGRFWALHVKIDWDLVFDCASKTLAEPMVQEALKHSRADPNKITAANEEVREAQLMEFFASNNPQHPEALLRQEVQPAQIAVPDGYQGQQRKGLRWGYGVQRWQDGTNYYGTFENDKGHGYGRFEFPDGAFYLGQVSDWHPDGYGALVEKNRMYRGLFRRGLPHGKGILKGITGHAASTGAQYVVSTGGLLTHLGNPSGPGFETLVSEVKAAIQLARSAANRANETEFE